MNVIKSKSYQLQGSYTDIFGTVKEVNKKYKNCS